MFLTGNNRKLQRKGKRAVELHYPRNLYYEVRKCTLYI